MTEQLFSDEASAPLEDRLPVDIIQRELHAALGSARREVSAHVGPVQWTDVDELATSFSACEDGGVSIGRAAGLTFDLADADFPIVVEAVARAVGPLGFKALVNTSTEKYYAVSIYDTQEGGWVRIGMVPGKGLSISFNSGSRPEPRTLPQAQV